MFDTETISAIGKIAERLDVPTAALLAVADVESGGRVLAKVNDRHEPLIRFEGHYFDRFLRGTQREQSRKDGLASPTPGRVKNPRSQQARWELLNRAISINRIAALSSCSWGLGQVMGAHWQWLGFGSVDALVAEARSGVDGQVKLMARYIDRAKLVEALQKQDWPKFARTYNGPAYAKNRYDVKMAAEFRKYSERQDEPRLPASGGPQSPDLMFGSRGREVRFLQKKLTALGYVLFVDGMFGLVTDRVVRQFQRDHLLEENGVVSDVERQVIFDGRSAMLAKIGGKIRKIGVQRDKKTTGILARLRKGLLFISNRFA